VSIVDDKKLTRWKVLGSEEILRTPWFVIKKNTYEAPFGLTDRYVHEAPDSVMCVCITEDGLIVVEEQFRPALNGESMDYPAGYMSPEDSSREQGALRELYEETGFVVEGAKHMFSLSKDPSFSSGKMHVVLATGHAERKREPPEHIVVKLLQPAQILEAIENGVMSCSFCVATSFRLANILNWKKLK
jgi:ADP-ribose pyrophosphatase